jgi:type I restriction enzyme M protein
MSPKGGIRPHKRFSVQSNRSEVLFVNYIAEHLTANGRAAVIVPEGIIFQSGIAYKQLRKMLVEEYLVGVISLPAGVFQPYSGVKTSILWLDKALAKKTDKILFVKINNDGYDLGAQRRAIKQNDLPVALQNIVLYKNRQHTHEIEGYNLVLKDVILSSSDCSLSGERYFRRRIISSVYDLVPCGSFLRRQVQTFDPRTKPNDNYELWSIPAFDLGRPEIFKGDSIGSAKKILVQGDVLLSRIVPHIRRSWVVSDTGTSCPKLGSTEWIIFNSDKLNSVFLKWILRSDVFHEQFMRTITGIGGSLSRASIDAVEEIRIPVPPLDVQQSIVTELGIYQKIVDGARMVVENYKPKIEIDPGWDHVRLETICETITDGDHQPPPKAESGVPFITISNISHSGEIDFDRTFFVPKSYYDCINFKRKPRLGDILYTVTGSFGIPVLVNFQKEFCFQRHIGLIRPKQNVNANFLYYYLKSSEAFDQAENQATGIAQKTVSLKSLRNFVIPLPSEEEQRRIVIDLQTEEGIVNSNKLLIQGFKLKIKNRIAKIWGEQS